MLKAWHIIILHFKYIIYYQSWFHLVIQRYRYFAKGVESSRYNQNITFSWTSLKNLGNDLIWWCQLTSKYLHEMTFCGGLASSSCAQVIFSMAFRIQIYLWTFLTQFSYCAMIWLWQFNIRPGKFFKGQGHHLHRIWSGLFWMVLSGAELTQKPKMCAKYYSSSSLWSNYSGAFIRFENML